jgi:aquaporin Z
LEKLQDMSASLGEAFRDEHVNYVITAPGKGGPVPAFIMEVLIAFVLMAMVLFMSNRPQTSRFTGLLAGGLVAIYVVVSGPVSGFSMNPARTLASAVPAGNYAYLWIYLTAPFMGMFAAAILYRRFGGITYCAKLHHVARYRCFFKCDYHEQQTENDL